MNDFETNWKNSEVVSVFADTYFSKTADLEVAPVARVSEILPSTLDVDFMFDNSLTIIAEFEREKMADDLKKIAKLASEDGNHKVAFLIESTIESLYIE